MKLSLQKTGNCRKILTTDLHGSTQAKLLKYPCLFVKLCGFIFFCLLCCFAWLNYPTQKIAAADSNGEIEQAIYTRQEFFGAQAIVPLPTAEARENLAKLAESSPDNPQILEKLAELDENSLRFDEAENILKKLAEIDSAKLKNLAAFYDRRARFADQGETLKKILFSSALEKRAVIFERLVDLARKHDLKNYLQTAFYSEVAANNPDIYPIFESLIQNLTDGKNYSEALNFVRQAKIQFPEKRNVLLEKEVELLLETNNPAEAERVYQANFDPFWSKTEAQKFYDFLNEQDRLRAYGAEIKTRFKKNPADFDAAIRLALYQNHDYSYGNDSIAPTILKLEKAKKSWTTEELVTVSRLLIQNSEAGLAARFLYTLYAREDYKTNSELRAKILYQLFEMFSDAENERLPITKGDLRFYEDVAKADTKPGIATGILSLIFSDTSPREQFDKQEMKANKLFNRAAAYRIFEEYKSENPHSTELAQMYLDIVQLYAAAKDTEIAEKTLNEFAANYENSNDFPSAALKLADALTTLEKEENARQIYQKTLDYLGKKGKFRAPKQYENIVYSKNLNESNPSKADSRNDGINIPSDEKTPPDYYEDENKVNLNDYLDRKNEAVTYEEVLEKLVASLAAEKNTTAILTLYSNEIAKYPDEEWLYERRLSWLEQTNLTAEQFEFYKTALARFKTNDWRDRLARFFVRNRRDQEFAEFSEDLIDKQNDTEIRAFLNQFVDANISATDLQKRLYIKLYQSAHERFPHNIAFVKGLLQFYKDNKMEEEWKKLCAEYYFESTEIRQNFLDKMARINLLRESLEQAKNQETSIYELFRADASARLSDFENSVAAYRKLNEIYPNTPEFSNRLINFTRSFGQKNPQILAETANISVSEADFKPGSAELRTRAGEIYAESGDYEKARGQWEKLIETAAGSEEIYLETATVYWDYFQYEDALRTIKNLRVKFGDETLYAFEAGAILEAEHKQIEAVGEYVKDLDASRDESQKEKAIKRLSYLSTRKISADSGKDTQNNAENIIQTAFSRESARRKDSSFLSLGYADFLVRNKRKEQAESVLNRAVGQSADKDFLEAAKDFYQTENNSEGEQLALQKLAGTIKNPRQTISYKLQLADSYAENQKRDAAKIALKNLVRQFPTNYGVLTESSEFFNRLGYENDSVQILKNALPLSRGAYRNALSGKLAERLVQLNQLDAAAQMLTNLHDQDKANVEIFDQLARVYVRTNKPEAMRKAFAETVAELKKSDADRRETDDQIAGLRVEMIDAFTKLKDYKSAIEQHLEIINREPENEELTENAIRYVERYGGAETLVSYYEKTAAESFKNYRWNVVLARIYEAEKDDQSALKNYRLAIDNQPEMPELYLAVADIETKRGNYDEALKNIDEVLKISGNEAGFVKKKIEILKKAGRFAEIETEKAKLPIEDEKKIMVDEFAEAGKLPAAEKEKAREIYRAAFEKLLENPLSADFKSADISGYVKSVREEESLDKISARLWILREKLIEIADASNSTEAGEARNRLSILDGALVESIGATAKTFGTDEELKNLHENWRRKIEEVLPVSDVHQTAALIQDLSRRANFGDLEELILLKKVEKNISNIDSRIYLRNLVTFYRECGAYQKSFDALEKYGSDDLSLKAEAARLVGNREKELDALRAIYWKPNEKISLANDENVRRYLEILNAENLDELKSLTEKSSVYQLQLINFLLRQGMREFAHAAIKNSNFSTAWKVSRNAETSLALREFDENSECFFCEALQFKAIGEMVKQTPDKRQFLINDDWFRLTREYGEWLFEKKDGEAAPSKYLAAMLENQPRSTDEQYKLGEFYLERGVLKSAVEHLRLAIENDDSIDAGDQKKLATLGAAYFKLGRTDYAEEIWKRILEDQSIESGAIYFQILQKYDLSREARKKLPAIIVKFLETNDAEKSKEFQQLIRDVAASFESEKDKANYFRSIIEKRPTDVSLAKMLVSENLIGDDEQKSFYQAIIQRSETLSGYDYNFKSVVQQVFTVEDAESVDAQENEYKTEEPQNERCEWQKKYLELLIVQRENAAAAQLAGEIEKELSGRYARPAWLIEAKIKLEIRAGKFDETELKRFLGISVSDSATEIKLPSIERFNDAVRILKEENQTAQAINLSEIFFARMLALEQFDSENFAGSARAFFQKNEPEKAIQILRLMIEASDADQKEASLAEISALDEVKAQAANATKISAPENVSLDKSSALRIAAELAAEFDRATTAIEFRRKLLETDSSDAANIVELAKLLDANGGNEEAKNLLTQIIGNQNTPRNVRWQARVLLNIDLPNIEFDPFSQFYLGANDEKSGQFEAAEQKFVNSLIADQTAETSARQSLIKLYAFHDKPFAALRLAETDKAEKPDELLDALSQAAEKTGVFAQAIAFENERSQKNAGRISVLQQLQKQKDARATDFLVDAENTRKL